MDCNTVRTLNIVHKLDSAAIYSQDLIIVGSVGLVPDFANCCISIKYQNNVLQLRWEQRLMHSIQIGMPECWFFEIPLPGLSPSQSIRVLGGFHRLEWIYDALTWQIPSCRVQIWTLISGQTREWFPLTFAVYDFNHVMNLYASCIYRLTCHTVFHWINAPGAEAENGTFFSSDFNGTDGVTSWVS